MKETIMSAADQLRQEGEFKKQHEIVVNMLLEGADDRFVTKTTGLSPEVLTQLKKDINQQQQR